MRNPGSVCWSVCGLVALHFIPALGASGQTSPLVHEGVVAAPVERVWEAYTTGKGLESWMAAHADFDLRVGGKMRTNYNKDGTLDDPGSIENTILAYEPMHMLSIKATKPPESFPFKQALEKMWTVVYFESIPPNRTWVRCVSMGFTDDEESQKMRAFFDRGNAYTLRKLQEHFAPAASAPADDPLPLVRRMIGGEWFHHSERRGKDFRVQMLAEDGPDGQSMVSRTLIGGGDHMGPHGRCQVWREPLTKRVLCQNLDETGAIARGELRMIGPDSVEWEWHAEAQTGSMLNYLIHTTFVGADQYHMKLFMPKDGKWEQSFDLLFERKTDIASRPALTRP